MNGEKVPFFAAYADLAFRKCLREAVANHELVEQFNRLHGAPLQGPHDDEYLHAFTRFVHESIYMRLADEVILALRVEPQQTETA